VSPKHKHTPQTPAAFAEVVGQLQSAAEALSLGDAVTPEHIASLMQNVHVAQATLDHTREKIEAAVPAGLYDVDLVAHARRTDPANKPPEYPPLDPRNEGTYALVLDFVRSKIGFAFKPYKLADYLRANGVEISDDKRGDAKANALLKGAQDRIRQEFAADGIEGVWTVHDGDYVFAPVIPIGTPTGYVGKKKEPIKTLTAEEIRDRVWGNGAPEEPQKPEDMPAEVVVEPWGEAEVLAYMSDLSENFADEKFNTGQLVDELAAESGITEDELKSMLGNLAAGQYIFEYRKGGEPHLTTNGNVAYDAELRRKDRRRGKNAAMAEIVLDKDFAYELVDTLLSTGRTENKYTIQNIWSMQQKRKGITVHHETPTPAEEDVIRNTAQSLSKLGVLFAGQYKAQTKGARHSARRTTFKIGFASKEQYALFKTKDEAATKKYLEGLVQLSK